MKIYLCGRYSRRDELRRYAAELTALGHVIVSGWLDTQWERKDDSGSSAAPAAYREEHAVKDMADVLACDCLVAFAEPSRSDGRGGRHVELGIALASGKRIIVVGNRENIFHHHPSVEFIATFGDVVYCLS